MALPANAKIYSADDHLIEPAHLWVDRVPAKYRDRAPHIEEVDGRECWVFEDQRYFLTMGSCRPAEGFSEEGYPPAPGTARYDEIRPGCYDATERLKDMDLDGVWAQLLFPNYARFAGHRFYPEAHDQDLALVCLQAYNDHLLEEWCAVAPDRIFGAAILPLHRMDDAVRELERVVAMGARAVAFSENPTVLGLPSIHTDYWDPLFAAAQEMRIPLCTHIGSSSRLVSTSPDAPVTVQVTLLGVNSMMAAADWLLGNVFDRFPTLKVILSEGGTGWIPYVVERADKVWHDHRIDYDPILGRMHHKPQQPPSVNFRDHMYACLVDERFALTALDQMPVDNILFEGDFPHGDGLFPNNRRYLEKVLADVPDDVATKIAGTTLAGLLQAG
jgi:predicted TIM-barrel fold metal-dependent hydrolase